MPIYYDLVFFLCSPCNLPFVFPYLYSRWLQDRYGSSTYFFHLLLFCYIPHFVFLSLLFISWSSCVRFDLLLSCHLRLPIYTATLGPADRPSLSPTCIS
ncbi:hypothetical protein BDV18DRAFT_53693 [Aspergillus unguis]